jgi:hypothetical protein
MSGAVLKAQRDTGQFFMVLHQRHSILNRHVEVALQYGIHYGIHVLCGGRPPSCRGSSFLRMRSLPLVFGEVRSEYPTTFSPSVNGFWLKRRVCF